MELDLASLASVRAFCATFNARGLPLHHLVCNAAAIATPQRTVTEDGNELHLQARGAWALPASARHNLVPAGALSAKASRGPACAVSEPGCARARLQVNVLGHLLLAELLLAEQQRRRAALRGAKGPEPQQLHPAGELAARHWGGVGRRHSQQSRHRSTG
jgi:NAD(P)-dependent dehydrogenase (short-subunit alcohol dehydrogenase family)